MRLSRAHKEGDVAGTATPAGAAQALPKHMVSPDGAHILGTKGRTQKAGLPAAPLSGALSFAHMTSVDVS